MSEDALRKESEDCIKKFVRGGENFDRSPTVEFLEACQVAKDRIIYTAKQIEDLLEKAYGI